MRYLTTARERLGSDELAVVSYHMGIGNLTNVLRLYAGELDASIPELVEERDLTWIRVFFDTAPDRNAAAHELLARLGDDSPTYYWRVLAAREIMRLYRDDRDRLAELDLLHGAKSSAEEVLHPPSETQRFADGVDLRDAWDEHVLQPLPDDPDGVGFSIDRSLGELSRRLGQPRELYRGLRPEALALLVYRRPSGRRALRARAAAPRDERGSRRRLPGAPARPQPRGHPRLLAAHDRIRIRRRARLRVRQAGPGVPVPARRPHRARPDRVDPRAHRDPHHSCP